MNLFQPTTRVGIAILLLGVWGISRGYPAGSQSALPTLALLDPVDLASGAVISGHGDFLRSELERAGRFRPLPRTEMVKNLEEYNWNTNVPCHEFQCGFDAGSVLLSDYVLIGTVTALDGLFAYTFNVLHVRSGRMVSSEAGDAPRNSLGRGDEPLKVRLAAYAAGLDPSRFDNSPIASRGLMAVVDLSAESPQSRVLAERVGTHVHASRQFDLMSQPELRELLNAMDISPAAIQTTDSGMIALGSRLNAAFLVHTKLSREANGNRLELALFDVAGKRRIRELPSKPTREFRDLLYLESRFFTTLQQASTIPASRETAALDEGWFQSYWTRGILTFIGLSATAGLINLAYSSHQDAEGTYKEAESAYNLKDVESLKRQTESKDRRTLIFGSLAALTLGASVTLWTF